MPDNYPAIPRPPLSESQEDYLKQILLLGSQPSGVDGLEDTRPVGTQALAHQIGVRPASVTEMLKKLSELGLVQYEAYRGVQLTPAGYRVALEVIRHHRLLEAYLHRALGYSWDEVHAEAEKLEHHISEALEARISHWLGHPSLDPHGDRIPTASLDLPRQPPQQPLLSLPIGQPATVVRVATQDQDHLNLLTQLGMVLGASITLLEAQAQQTRLLVATQRYLLANSLLEAVWVNPTPQEA